ncbi:MAG: amino acid--tRNA ligase-related protein, partial [Thermodesulfobacteriota bacterium]|nr:amino acid--tRNA ligase-related protein [Thermodesulfobacteriota bacterium]
MEKSALSTKGTGKKHIKLPVKSPFVDRFQPLLKSLDEKGELNEVLKNRVAKACALLDQGAPLFPNTYRKDTDVGDILEKYSDLDEAGLAGVGVEFSLAGRVLSLRSFGKAAFFHLMDHSGKIQVHAQRDNLGEDAYKLFKKIDIGDIVGVRGGLFRTKTNELTVRAGEIVPLSKSMRPLPEKYHGLKDVETRYRRRYVDLIVTEKTREIFKKRTAIVREFRNFLDARGFMEVETPMMQPIPGGAAARPFVTRHKALDMELYMRIAPELYLKRLLVGGFEKVYEINRNFRNEGISTQHNPEFTMCEFYQAYATYEDLMNLTEELFAHIAEEVAGSLKVPYQGQTIDLTPGTWKRVTFFEALEKIGGLSPDLYNDQEAAAEHVVKQGEKAVKG